jgi:hypothetical protein
MSCVCYLVLVAFISVISMEVSYSSFQHQKTEVSSNKSGINGDLHLLFEEERDTDTALHYSLLSQYVFAFDFLIRFSLPSNYITLFTVSINHIIHKAPLFLSYRSLRL